MPQVSEFSWFYTLFCFMTLFSFFIIFNHYLTFGSSIDGDFFSLIFVKAL